MSDSDLQGQSQNAVRGDRAPPPSDAQPYGLGGLIVSLFGIVFLGMGITFFCALAFFLVVNFDFTGVKVSIHGLAGLDINEIRNASWETQMAFYGLIASSFVGFGLATLAFAWFRGGRDWRAPIAWIMPTGWPSGAGLAWLAFGALVYLLFAGYGVKLIFPDFRTWFFVPTGIFGILLSLVTVVLLAPWAEELLFRGWIYSSLRASFGVWPGVIVTTLLFALAHLDPTRLYPVLIFVPGLVLTMIREKNGSTKASFYAHASYNGLAWVVVYFVGNS